MKTILSPAACAYRREDVPPTSEYFKCIHSKNFNGNCDNTNKFPYDCPLDDAPTLNRAATLKLLKKYLPNILVDKIIDLIYA